MLTTEFKRVAKILSENLPGTDVYTLLELTDKVVSVFHAKDLVSSALYDAQIVQFCADNQKMNAIKRLRALTSCGLKDAKEAIEDERVWGTYAPS